jgi:hypothetical protein
MKSHHNIAWPSLCALLAAGLAACSGPTPEPAPPPAPLSQDVRQFSIGAMTGIDLREDEGTVASFAQSLSVIFPMGLDEAGRTQEAWDVIALPMHFWIDTEGVIRDGAFGGIGPDIMADGLRTILPGVEIET